MRIKVLGYNGSIGSDRHTTSFLIDDDVLLDAGTGVGTLSLEEIRRIKHVFLTHSHLDHLAGLPLMLDSIFHEIDMPVTVHGLGETLATLREHIFNWKIWPDFTVLPSADRPVVRVEALTPGNVLMLNQRKIHMIPVNHVVPTVGYCIEDAGGVFAFSGDTTTNDGFWEALNRQDRLDLLFVEVAFPDKNIEVAHKARHYCPRLLAADIGKLRHRPRICITHPKPGFEDMILHECQTQITDFHIERLTGSEVFVL